MLPATIGTVAGAEFAVSGQTAGENDFVEHMTDALPWVIGFVLLLTFLVMLWAFRAPVIALSAIGLNLLSAGAAYGLLVLVFQNTWAEGLLGFTSTGGITAWLPVILFVTLFGLSMDYHVFVVSRIRESVGAMSTKDAIAAGHHEVGGRGDERGSGHDRRVLDLRDPEHDRHEADGCRPCGRDPDRRDPDPRGPPAGADDVLGKANWWTPRFLRKRAEINANEETRVLEPVG